MKFYYGIIFILYAIINLIFPLNISNKFFQLNKQLAYKNFVYHQHNNPINDSSNRIFDISIEKENNLNN